MRIVTMALIAVVLAFPAAAALLYDERVDGDFAGEPAAAALLALQPGHNRIAGRANAAPILDRDFWAVEVPAGWMLSEIILEEYADDPGFDIGGAFMAVKRGRGIPNLDMILDTHDSSSLLGATLFGKAPGEGKGDDILDDLAVPFYPAMGFAAPLDAGTYTFWVQQTSGETTYTLDFVVTPLPAAAPLLVGGLVGLLALGRVRDRGRRPTVR